MMQIAAVAFIDGGPSAHPCRLGEPRPRVPPLIGSVRVNCGGHRWCVRRGDSTIRPLSLSLGSVFEFCIAGGLVLEGKIQNLDEGFSVSELFAADAEAFTVFFGLFSDIR